MTVPRDPDSSLEELLRSAMRGEADSVSPAGDGLARIQERVALRRRQRFWLRPVAVVGAAAFAGGAGFTAYALTAHPDTNATVSTNPTPSTPPSLAASPTASITPTTPPPPTTAFPASAFYPFTSAAAEVSWEAQNGATAQPWITDAVAEAKDFIAKFVLVDGVDTVTAKQIDAKAASVTLGRTMNDAGSQRAHDVTTVHLQRYGKAWLVLGATDAGGLLRVASPASGQRVTSPLSVSGPGFGTDEAVQVDVRAIGAPSLTAPRAQAQFGAGVATWSATAAFGAPSDPRGAVVAIEDSAADGGPARIAVTGVRFATDTTGYPAYFYSIKNDRVTKFSSRDGAAVSYLTKAEPGGGPSDPQLVGDRIYYLSGSGTCANALRSVPVAGGGSTLVASPQVGYLISSYAVTSDQAKVALFETSCLGTATPRGMLVSRTMGTSQSHTLKFDAFPPELVSDPSWEPDGTHLDAVMTGGTSSSTVRFDTVGGTSIFGDGNACPGADQIQGQPDALEIDSSGALWVALRTGSSMTVERCIGSTARVMFTVAGNLQPADLAVAGSGNAVMLSDLKGHVWRWTQGGDVVKLTPSIPLMNVTW